MRVGIYDPRADGPLVGDISELELRVGAGASVEWDRVAGALRRELAVPTRDTVRNPYFSLPLRFFYCRQEGRWEARTGPTGIGFVRLAYWDGGTWIPWVPEMSYP